MGDKEREKIAKAPNDWKTKEMPALANPRWERFAQLIVEGLMNGDRKAYSQGRAYIAAGYEAKDAGKRGGSAEAAASRLLNRVKPIIDRVRELQAEATKRLQPKLDLSRERIGRDLDEAYRTAKDQKNASAIATSQRANDRSPQQSRPTTHSLRPWSRSLLRSAQ